MDQVLDMFKELGTDEQKRILEILIEITKKQKHQ